MPAPIPPDLLPRDGRFGCGPSKVPPEALDALATRGRTWMGTSHRQAPVKDLVGRLRRGLTTLYDLPDGYEVVLGNGGSSLFWDAASLCLVERRASVGVFGEFGGKFASVVERAPWLDAPAVREVPPGSAVLPTILDGTDAYAWPHNETSTGACAPVRRQGGIGEDALTLVDATSAAGAIPVDLSGIDAYYFAPQKAFAADGGLWVALLSPAALARSARLTASRWVPDSLNLSLAATNAAANQTLNTPALATLFLMAEQLEKLLASGGLAWASARTRASASRLYGWAEASAVATPFVERPFRSPVVGTIDFVDEVDAAALASRLRANGIVDVEPYRKLGRNQLRVGMFPAVEPADVDALVACIDWCLEHPA